MATLRKSLVDSLLLRIFFNRSFKNFCTSNNAMIPDNRHQKDLKKFIRKMKEFLSPYQSVSSLRPNPTVLNGTVCEGLLVPCKFIF